MRLKITLILLLFALTGSAQLIPKKLMDKVYGHKKDEVVEAAVELKDSSLVFAGYTDSKGSGKEDIWLFRVSPKGKLMWEKFYGGNKTDKAASIVLTSDNKLIVGGFTESEGAGDKDQYVLKTDLDGSLLWSKTYGSKDKDRVYDALPGDDGSVIITGYETLGNSSNIFLARLDKYGKPDWKMYYGGKGAQVGFALDSLPGGGYIIAGAKSVGGQRKSQNWLIKTDKDGNKKWEKRFGVSNTLSRITAIYVAADSTVFMAGNNIRSAGRRLLNKNWVARYDNEGNEMWAKSFQQHQETRMNRLLALPDTSMMITSVSKQGYSLIGKISYEGSVKWRTSYGSPEKDQIRYIDLLKSGNILFAGYNESKGAGRKDGWAVVVKDDKVIKAIKAREQAKKEKKEQKAEKKIADKKAAADTAQKKKKYIDVSLKPDKDAFTLVKEYVEKHISEWAEQGEYESTEAYNERVSLEKRKAKEEALSQKALNKYGSQMISLEHAELVENSYNPDEETFLIKLNGTEDVRLHVPRSEAPDFKSNWDTHKFTRVDYGLLDEKFVVAKADVVVNYRTYRFNAREDAKYGDKMKTIVYSSATRSMFPTPYSAAVRHVKKGIDEFMKRGEFETSEDYQKRTSETNIAKKEKKLTREAFKMQANDELDLANAKLGRYNADKQFFPVKVPATKEIKLPVPIEEGRMVKNNWNYYQFRNVAYGLYEGTYVFDTLQIIVNDSVYSYNSRKHAEYGDEIIRRIDLDNIDYSKLDDKTYAMFFEGERPTETPSLFITNITLDDADQNGILNATENASFLITIRNNGKGKAYKTVLQIQEKNRVRGVAFKPELEIGTIAPMSKKQVKLPLDASENLMAGQAFFSLKVTEMRDYDSNKKNYKLQTAEFKEPFLVVTEPYFATENGGKVELGESVYLKMLVENQGEGAAKNVKVEFIKPKKVVNAGRHQFDLGLIPAGESKAVNYEFIPKKTFTGSKIPVEIIISEKYNKYGNATTTKALLNKELMPYTEYNLVADVDKNIPKLDTTFRNRYAIIIGNEDYHSYQEIGSEANVDFAAADAIVFKRYAVNVLGIPEENIEFKINARKHEMQRAFNQVMELAKTSSDSVEIFFFYAGHGFPDEKTKEAYIMPVNITGSEVREGIKLADLYSQFSNTKNVKRITGFIDACFSGGGRAEGLLAARGIKVKPKEAKLQQGNIIVYSASTGDQVSLPYKAKNHGMFTYALLKKLQDSAGDITYGELKKYLEHYVQEQSRRVNNKDQKPSVNVSPSAQGVYSEWELN